MKKFKKIYIEITNTCNLSCDFCPKCARPSAFMSSRLFEDILQKTDGVLGYIYFHVMGEPLLHPEIGLFLDLSQKYSRRVNITTNGTLIQKAGDIIISKPALRQVNFSLHSFEANTGNISMDCYLDNIFDFIHRSRKLRELLICLRLWNLSCEDETEKNRHILTRIEREFDLNYTIKEKLTPCSGIKIAQNIFLNQAEKFDWPDIRNEEIGHRGFCYGLRDQVAILVDGTVVPCCLDREAAINLGNIHECSFDEIINSPRAQKFYEGFSRREAVEALCRRCGYRQRFGR